MLTAHLTLVYAHVYSVLCFQYMLPFVLGGRRDRKTWEQEQTIKYGLSKMYNLQ